VTAQQVAQTALDYRDGNAMFARFDLQAALDHGPDCRNCSHRIQADTATIREAIHLLGGP